MTFKVGDKVRITKWDSRIKGDVGRVIKVHETTDVYEVQFDNGIIIPYYGQELEAVG